MTTTPKPVPRDPESVFYDTIKRKRVVVGLASGAELVGILEWVSTYSIGVRPSSEGAPGPGPANVVLVMKGSLATIEEA